MCPSGRDSYRAAARGRDRISPGEEWAGRVHSRPSKECEPKDRGAKIKNGAEKTPEARGHAGCVETAQGKHREGGQGQLV